MTRSLLIEKMKMPKKVVFSNSLRNRKESIKRPGVYKKRRKQTIKLYTPPNLLTPKFTYCLLHLGEAAPVKSMIASWDCE